jgi:Tfp pilus assembly protein FimT
MTLFSHNTISRFPRVKGSPLAWFMRSTSYRRYSRLSGQQDGFSVIELIIAGVLILVLSAFAIPAMVSSVRTAHLRGAASDMAGLYEQARIYAIRDNNYYSTYVLAASGSRPQLAYVDLPNGSTAKNGGTAAAAWDPVITLTSEVVQQAVGSAPNTANLKSQLLPSTTPVTPIDTSVTAATFGPRGLPCTPLALTGGSVCDSAGGPTAYWTFLKNTNSGGWQAVTITPAGRIGKWFYTGSVWQKL